ncbi:MAG: serine hydrolase [Thermodesulfobacteriota bacterium]|nr:serine hydrolase [Thermodesulfobacteriota bacterium]
MCKLFKFLVFGSLLILSPQYVFAAQDSQAQTEVERILQERVDKYKKSVGLIVGLVNDQRSKIISYGKLSQDHNQKPDGNTVFEIGSITKVFTSLLLSDMIERKELRLSDPITNFLPKSVKVPTKDGKEITLLHLATHTSGLPRLPSNFAPKNINNPYADYTVQQMYEFLSNYTLTRDIGAKYEYSNLGSGLLGHILALKAGTDFETLVVTRICGPLKMNSTRIKLSTELQTRMATGHDQNGKTVMNWDIPTLSGAGALRSTANDMLNFVAANLSLTKSDLSPVMQKTHLVRNNTGVLNLEIGLGWHVLNKYGTEIVWHNGGTGGYHSFIGFDKKKRVGVVVLSNSTNDIDDIGLHLLENKYALANLEPSKGHTTIKLDPEIYGAYVGQYELAPNFIITIIREGDGLYAQATGQGKFEIYPEAKTKFFYKVVDAQIMFNLSEAGVVESLTLYQSGREMPAKKLK